MEQQLCRVCSLQAKSIHARIQPAHSVMSCQVSCIQAGVTLIAQPVFDRAYLQGQCHQQGHISKNLH